MVSAYVASLGFGTYYFIAGVEEVYLPAAVAFLLFVLYGILSFFNIKLVLLFRLSILTASLAFYNQIFYTGGILSPALIEFIIPPLLAFFYRPVRDRYVFMIVSFLAMISFWPLTYLGVTESLLPEEYFISHSVLCAIFVFLIVTIFTVLFRNAIVTKNEQLGNSMRQLQETTQKLIESEKMASLGILSAGVAHEINNPLNFIKGGIEVLENELQEKNPDFSPATYIQVIKEGLRRASTIVNSLSHFSRQTEAVDENCDLHAILNNTVVMLQPKLKYKGTVLKEYDTGVAHILGNEGKLHQAFLNIISNAEHAIDKQGTIKISTKIYKQKITVKISDDGVGISKEHINKISDPFFTTKPVGQGTGLGLAITYKIIKEHRGEIKVSSKIGKGTTFTITFPRL